MKLKMAKWRCGRGCVKTKIWRREGEEERKGGENRMRSNRKVRNDGETLTNLAVSDGLGEFGQIFMSKCSLGGWDWWRTQCVRILWCVCENVCVIC